MGFIGVKLGCKFRQKSHNNTIGIIYESYILDHIYFSGIFFPVFFLGGKSEVVVVFSYAFFFLEDVLMFEKVPKETCPVVALGVFFPMF